MILRSVSPAYSLSISLALFLTVGCGGGSSSVGNSGTTSVATPSLTSITPSAVSAGSLATTLTTSGTNFVQGSQIAWNGTARATLYVSPTSLQAPLTNADFATPATISISVQNPPSAGGTTSNTLPLVISASVAPNSVPTILSLSPSSAASGSAALSLVVTGTGFASTSVINWNGAALVTTYNSTTSLSTQVPATDLASPGSAAITVTSPAPGGGTSNALTFTITATGAGGQITIPVAANSLAWDPVNQVIYLSLPSTDGANGNSVQILNPTTGTLGASAFAGSEPNLLAVSSSSKYLYVSLSGASNVQRMTLPALGTDIKIALGADSFDGPYYAMDLQAAPNGADGSVAVVRGVPNVSPEEEGGVVIYDDGVARTSALCGFIQSGCTGNNFGALFDSIQWNSTGTEMFAANNEDTGFDFYTVPVSSTGFGKAADYGGLAGGFGENIHYDAKTALVYDDNGSIIDPVAAAKIGTFAASGLMVPDGAHGKAYFLGQALSSYGSSTYTLQSFDINKFVLVDSITIKNIVGTPTHLIRWGTNGLAFTTSNYSYGSAATGAVYIISGTFISEPAVITHTAGSIPTNELVQRSWPARETQKKLPAEEKKTLHQPR